ncbi:leucyl aminopeptidase [Caulobacter radicis]|uniref:leucyl aminopeptidase n=1 Tax=Caulobacter radicis TaxID=2172650 RepID=UPI000D56423A|nr:leucyl aminopeptidase [Caulobacter radicis]PVM84508.1 leucyl aminopeptidase [Caulobacter radicis]
MHVEFITPDALIESEGAIAALVFSKRERSEHAQRLDAVSGGALTRAIAADRFTGDKGQVLSVLPPGDLKAARVVLVGVGDAAGLDSGAIEVAAATAYNGVKDSGIGELVLALDSDPAMAASAAFGARLAAYRFAKYRTKLEDEKKPSVTLVKVVANDVTAARVAYMELSALADAIEFSRDLVSEPPNVLFPGEFAGRVRDLERLGLEVEVLGETEMAALGMGSLLCVGQGSARESHLVVMRWNGAAALDSPVAFVGKGVCFDSGGLSIKPAPGMEDMKWDMGGAAAVAGLMHALAGRKAKVNAVAVLGLVENMPDGRAVRPGDVVTSMSGQTIEVINTDAEGRLVLADALWYCQDHFKPRAMIDLATLTGAIVVALGSDYAGLFSNDDTLSGALLSAGVDERELLWRQPLPAAYDKQIDSMIADMKNIGGKGGGSITAALFLQRFVAGVPWAHIDIASTAWRSPSIDPTVPEGASGFGVRLLNRLVADLYEA